MGILASDVGDSIRTYARPLAFQDKGESYAWLPDSSPTSFDKENVRNGHYPIWGPSHFITQVNDHDEPNPLVAKLITALNGTDVEINATLDVIGLYAKSHIVPQCAMKVQRTSDGQSYSQYIPPGSTACDCYYDYVLNNEVSSPCQSCTTAAGCATAPGGATSCNVYGIPAHGFCEKPGM